MFNDATKEIAPDPGGAGSRAMHRKKWGSLSTTMLINDLHSNKHISIDSVALCLEQTFCDGYHSAIQSLLTFELSTNWARQTEKRDGPIGTSGIVPYV